MNRRELEKRLSPITNELLAEKGYIAFADVFMRLGYLSAEDYDAWRRRKIPFLEKAVKINLKAIGFVMKTVIRNCRNGKLKESRTDYRSWGKGRKIPIRFSKTGERNIEEAWATHFLKGAGMDDGKRYRTECLKKIDAFCEAYPQHRPLAPKARRVLDMLIGSGEPFQGKPGGWAGGIVHALTYTGCGVPGVLNADLEKCFDASIGTIRKRGARIEKLFDIRP